MANNSSTINEGGVSYLKVYKSWLLTDKRRDRDFTIPIKQILHDLLDSNLLTKSEYQEVYHEITDAAKVRKLFYEHMPAKGDEGFNQVVDSLNGNKNFDLANDLIAQRENCSFRDTLMAEQNQTVRDVHASPRPVSNPKSTTSPRRMLKLFFYLYNIEGNKYSDALLKVQDPLMVEAQEHLSKFIILNIDFMAGFWSDKLLVSNTWSTYADVQVLEDFKDDKGTVVHEYDEVFVTFNRILIQGDPGCGKSTYVNKIAVDWAKKQGYLREKFDLVFLISLETLEVGIEQAIRNLLPQRSSMIEFVEDYYKSHSSEVLLILDGFDEFPEDSPFYPEVMNMLEGDRKMSQFSFFTTIVTSRRSHVDKVPKRFHARSLLIKGFDEQSMKLFLQTQNVPAPDEQTDPNLVVLLQNPFFCAIYCSLHFFGVDKSKLEDPYDFVKALVENAVKIETQTKGITNAEDQLQLLGAFAFQKLSSETLNVVEKLFPTRETFFFKLANIFKKKPKHVQRIDTSKIQLGLLIKKKIPTVGVEYNEGIKYNEDVGLPHQLIAEYLAARYFIRSTRSQLKQLQPEKLVQSDLSVIFSQLILSSPSSLPFVRFLLFEYLNLHLHDVRNKRELILHWLTDEFRFVCFCKSKSETSTISDITSLNWKKIDSEIRHDSQFFPTLAKCNQLKSLNFSCNEYQYIFQLSTNEASELVELLKESHLPNLTTLELSGNRNVGSTPALFAVLGKCKQLERLDLQKCYPSIESINRLTTCIDNNCWVKLSQLVLSDNRNVGSKPALFSALGNCKQLERLDLQWCDLSIESIKRLTTCIDDNCWVKLSQLDLSCNRNVGSTPALFPALGKCKQLDRLDLQSCDLSIESINRLTTCIDDNCWGKLSQFNLSGNSNVGSTPALFTALGKCKQLERLDLQFCDLSIESIKRLTTCIDDNCWVKLSQFSLSDNSNVGSTPALFAALGNCKQLEKLHLQSCDLSTESINRLTTCIDDNCWVKFSQFNLSDHSNVDSTPVLFTALGNCKQLERLDLHYCDLSIESINRLTVCIDDNCWVKLSQLDLSCNSKVGSTPALFTALGKCKQLERLDLHYCNLSIESINRLTTCIDDNYWPNLAILDLDKNTDVGSAKDFFRVLHKCLHLQQLSISSCSMINQSMNTFLSTFNLNTFQDLEVLTLCSNDELEIDDNFYLSLLSCSKISSIKFISTPGPTECELSTFGQKAMKALLDRGCKIPYEREYPIDYDCETDYETDYEIYS